MVPRDLSRFVLSIHNTSTCQSLSTGWMHRPQHHDVDIHDRHVVLMPIVAEASTSTCCLGEQPWRTTCTCSRSLEDAFVCFPSIHRYFCFLNLIDNEMPASQKNRTWFFSTRLLSRSAIVSAHTTSRPGLAQGRSI